VRLCYCTEYNIYLGWLSNPLRNTDGDLTKHVDVKSLGKRLVVTTEIESNQT